MSTLDFDNLMAARLGVYEKRPYSPPGAVEGIDEQSLRLRHDGGHRQQERMILQKRRSFDRATFNSYQATEIAPVGETNVRHRALINPNITKQDYDDKILSVGYEYNYKPGSVLEWYRKKVDGTIDTSYWLIYLQDLTELAYFKGDIRKCNYWVNWRNEKGELMSTWFALRGPVETKIDTMQKDGISVDIPNHSLNILMPKTTETIKYFQRYNKFYVNNSDELTEKICWRIEATDTLSMPGILELTAVEYYANEYEDDIENGIVGELVVKPIEPEDSSNLINGETYIKPKQICTYTYMGDEEGSWSVDAGTPVDLIINGSEVQVSWLKNYSGEFVLYYGSVSKTIKVESLF